MFDHFLTNLLQIVIVIDVLGAIAYFALGASGSKSAVRPRLKSRGPRSGSASLLASSPKPWPADRDFARLQRVLYGFQDGLA